MKLQKNYGLFLIKLIPIYNFLIFKNELTLTIPLTKLLPIITFLKQHTNSQFKILSDICGVDYLNKKHRFELVYNLLSLRYNSRLRLKIRVNETNLIDSVIPVYFNANWYEREIWDMFGIFFTNHPELRRILTDYGFEGHPLRKDFPVTGFLEVYYDELKKRVKYANTQISQKNKSLSFPNPWAV